jgi:hypothetical protein
MKTFVQQSFYALTAATALGLGASVASAAVTVPYVNNFSTSVSDFTENTDAQWTLNTSAGVYNNTYTAVNTTVVSTSSVQTASLAGASPFTLSTSFRLNSFDNTQVNRSIAIGMGLLAGNATFSGGATNPYYQVSIVAGSALTGDDAPGMMRIVKVDAATTFLKTGSLVAGPLSTNVWYDMTVVGTYNPSGDLILSFTVTNTSTPTQTLTLTTDPLTSPLDGQHFGYRQRVRNADVNVDFNEFALIPEPASLGLLGLGGLMMLRRRR